MEQNIDPDLDLEGLSFRSTSPNHYNSTQASCYPPILEDTTTTLLMYRTISYKLLKLQRETVIKTLNEKALAFIHNYIEPIVGTRRINLFVIHWETAFDMILSDELNDPRNTPYIGNDPTLLEEVNSYYNNQREDLYNQFTSIDEASAPYYYLRYSIESINIQTNNFIDHFNQKFLLRRETDNRANSCSSQLSKIIEDLELDIGNWSADLYQILEQNESPNLELYDELSQSYSRLMESYYSQIQELYDSSLEDSTSSSLFFQSPRSEFIQNLSASINSFAERELSAILDDSIINDFLANWSMYLYEINNNLNAEIQPIELERILSNSSLNDNRPNDLLTIYFSLIAQYNTQRTELFGTASSDTGNMFYWSERDSSTELPNSTNISSIVIEFSDSANISTTAIDSHSSSTTTGESDLSFNEMNLMGTAICESS